MTDLIILDFIILVSFKLINITKKILFIRVRIVTK